MRRISTVLQAEPRTVSFVGTTLSAAARTRTERDATWREVVTAQGFDAARQMIAADETRAAPEAAARLRLAVLLAVYDDDYRADCFDVDRIAARIADGSERIVFWGDAEAVTQARAQLHDSPVSGRPPPALGTATVLDATAELGPGYAEMCRTGSIARRTSGTAPVLMDLMQQLATGVAAHTFASVPRNRRSTPNVVGGAAIHRMHVRSIRSEFWGFAPWYLMQGGSIEVLDYRELPADPGRARAVVAAALPVVLASQRDADFVEALHELNLYDEIRDIVTVADGTAAGGWRIEVSSGGDAGASPCVVVPQVGGAPLSSALHEAEALGSAAVVIRVPLEAAHVAAQAELAERGYPLGAVLPAKVGASAAGLFSRPVPGVPLAEPYYLNRRPSRDSEARVLAHLRRLMRQWKV